MRVARLLLNFLCIVKLNNRLDSLLNLPHGIALINGALFILYPALLVRYIPSVTRLQWLPLRTSYFVICFILEAEHAILLLYIRKIIYKVMFYQRNKAITV